jgi:5-methylcytosine-specific restriction endonuclease McrA
MKVGEFLDKNQFKTLEDALAKYRIRKERKLMQKLKIEARKQALLDKEPDCQKCHKRVRLTIDHIIPKRMLRAAKVPKRFWDKLYNLQTYCYGCNLQKHHYIDLDGKTVFLMVWFWIVAKYFQIKRNL